MYNQMSVIEVLPLEAITQLRVNAEIILDAMESGALDYSPVLWQECYQVVANLKAWAIFKAETYGFTNVTGEKFGPLYLPPPLIGG